VKEGEEDRVYRLKKALYDLKQTPKAWYNKIETYFVPWNTPLDSTHSLFSLTRTQLYSQLFHSYSDFGSVPF